MKAQVATLCALLIALSLKETSAADTNRPTLISTNFVADAVLKPEEIAAVVRLAKSCGVGQVAKVETFHYLPTVSRGILITSVERTNGRKITFDTVEVFREGWESRSTPPAQARSSGQFWVDVLQSPTVHELTTFITPQGTIRVDLGSGTPIDLADSIVTAFTSGRIRYSDEFIERQSRRADFLRPNWLRKTGEPNLYEISFSGGLNRYKFMLVGGEVRITAVIHVNM
jgi:hypothetical protein